MPQFQTVWFLSESFWMLLCFAVLYLFVRYVIFPLVRDVVQERKDKVKNDLSVAEVVNKQAARLIQEYKGRIYSAEQTKAEIINETYRDIQKYSAHVDAEYEQKFRQQIELTERKVRQAKAEVVEQSDSIADGLAAELVRKLSAVKPVKSSK